MSESVAESTQQLKNDDTPVIEIEIVSDEEMTLIDAAFASASRCSLYSSSFTSQFLRQNVRSIHSITFLAKRPSPLCVSAPEIEESGRFPIQKRNRVRESLLDRYRKNRLLMVTDLTGTDWCGKQKEYSLVCGGQRVNKAMRAGQARHLELEAEVIKKDEVQVQSQEDTWAIKFMNFIYRANQLLSEGLTRELPLYGIVESVWMVGVIDEIQISPDEANINPMILETKTRRRQTLPAEAQINNGRFQLMLYKYMWDKLSAGDFPSSFFYNFFSLNPCQDLSKEVREHLSEAGCEAKTLDDIVRLYISTWNALPPAQDKLLLRYEFQKDNSLIGEVPFTYDHDWLMDKIQNCLEVWKGEREADYVPEEERWKCNHCQFAGSICQANVKSFETSSDTIPRKKLQRNLRGVAQ